MKPILVIAAIAAFGLAAGGCASSPKKGETANAATEKKESRPWWKIPKSLRKEGFDYWTYGEVRPGKGLLSDDEDGIVVYNEPARGSADPSKPDKVRR